MFEQAIVQPMTTVEISDVLYKTVDGISLYLDIIRPEPIPAEPMPVVVYIHGGGWMQGDRKVNRNSEMAPYGFFTVSIDYRLSGQACFPAQIEDAKAAVRWVRAHAEEYHLNPERIGVWGHSAGGHLAALLGTSADVPELEGEDMADLPSSRVQAVVDLCGPTDLLQIGGWHDLPDAPEAILIGGPIQEHPEKVRKANPLTYIRQNNLPSFLMVHGTDDAIVPMSQSILLYDALKATGADVTFVSMEGEDHNLIAFGEEVSLPRIYQMAREFFLEKLS